MPGCPRVDDVIVYSLRQMSGAEAIQLKAHLDGCASCRLKLSEVEETVGLLPLASPQVSPPPGLRARVVGEVEREAAEANRRRESRRRWSQLAWVGAASLLAVLLGGYSLLQVEGLRERLNAFAPVAAAEQVVTLVGTEAAPQASGRMLVAREGTGARISLQVQGLPALQGGQAYQLWLVKNGQRTNGGVFVVDATGKGGLATSLPVDLAWDYCGVTLEPDAFGTQPRGKRMMASTGW